MKKRVPKHASDELHCIRRLRERFQVEIAHDEFRRISNVLRDQRAACGSSPRDISFTFLKATTNSRSLYSMTYKGHSFLAVYSKSTKCIVTVMFTDEVTPETAE